VYDCITYILYYILAYNQHNGYVSLDNHQLHVPAALPPWKETSKSVRQMDVWVPEPVSTLWRREVSLRRKSSPDLSGVQSIA
jgi:hypothetical protein